MNHKPMQIPILTRQQLEIINRQNLQYPLAIAEKDYFLAIALHIIYDSPLKDKLVFKGGTALHHAYLPQYRFSEDLDFTAIDDALSLQDVIDVLEASEVFTARKHSASRHVLKIDRLRYPGLLGQAGNIKVEINTTQEVLQKAMPREYSNVWGVSVTPPIMDITEICAEKTRAASQRARYRDFYDLYLILTELDVDFAEAIALLQQKETSKPISQPAMLANWQVAQEQQNRELRTIFCAKEVENEQIESLIQSLAFAPIEP